MCLFSLFFSFFFNWPQRFQQAKRIQLIRHKAAPLTKLVENSVAWSVKSMFLHSLIGSLPSSPGRHNSCLLHSIVVLITACFKLNCKKAKVPKDVSREKERKKFLPEDIYFTSLRLVVAVAYARHSWSFICTSGVQMAFYSKVTDSL